MQIQTLPNTPFQPKPVQTGEPYHCWECSAPDLGGMFLLINHSPLQAYADHIYYMHLRCGHNPRCVRLGDAITPAVLDRSSDENLAHIRESLAYLASVVPPDRQNQDQVAKTIYLLLAGRISPQTAINQLRGPLHARLNHYLKHTS